ncbi:GNAT family N-acetyltransferase [Paracoccus aminophilus]|uniref:GCN5-related N-acetyltransferase n=1 Tax=Paracoccus aminophilus JCM 7686 TaxID=1367847 RepID=S5YDI1_PARAH|nr:GNAT family protein [Paracoccus aminophilus]AGT09508.1 GCN5-related N-acetyltransferase [Paracoccus aminophilus JCM 7686]
MQARPIGAKLTDFTVPPAPGPEVIAGRYVALERLDPSRHADDLYAANAGQDWVWDYMGYGPFATLGAYRAWQAEAAAKADPCFYALRDLARERIGGLASYLRIDRNHGVIEIGHIEISPAMQRSPAATEAISLMIGWAFDHGYRRVEWKCDALNAPSMAAAKRYGFRYEGTFRQHMIYKGRNRDTAWWAIIDKDWPPLAKAHQSWLTPENFDADGRQKLRLSVLTEAASDAASRPSHET